MAECLRNRSPQSGPGAFIQQLNAQTIQREGEWVTLPGGMRRKAIVSKADATILTQTEEDDQQQKVAVVFVFAGTDWGLITEDMVLTTGGPVTVDLPDGTHPSVDMSRRFKVAAPLDPRKVGEVVTEFSVSAYPDV